jgi:ribosomal protein S18 acetylase RimI-like enzyme
MAPRIHIRLYDHLRDARKFTSLNYQTFRDSIPQDEFVNEADFKRHYQWLIKHFAPQDQRKNKVFVAEIEGEYAGHCWLGQQTDFFTRRVDPWVFDLSVVPKFRGQGVARKLHEAVVEYLKEQGYERIGLQVMAHNESAALMYEKLGYVPRAISLKLQF